VGNTTAADFKFTLKTIPPAMPTFNLAQGTADAGPDTTTATRVTLVGQTDPGVTVSVVGTNLSAQAAGSGAFQIPGVSLAVGANPLQVTATDAAGNTSTASRTVTRSSSSAPPNAVIVWNQAALVAIQTDATDPLFASRGLAMVQAAVFDAANAIEGTPGYYVKLSAPAGASVAAAVNQAAHDVLVYLYPDQQATFDALLTSQIAQLPVVQATTDGQNIGKAACRRDRRPARERRLAQLRRFRADNRGGQLATHGAHVRARARSPVGERHPLCPDQPRPVPAGGSARLD
jgi:hypothetical protein